MDGPKNILIVEDEVSIREPLAQYLAGEGISVCEAADAATARSTLGKRRFDIIILDIMMPGEDGLSLCRHIRETRETPIILVTARTDPTDRIVGLEIGADDYVLKPFNPRELLARIRAVLRRARFVPTEAQQHANLYHFGAWTLDAKRRALIDRDGIAVSLSTGEFELLRTFVSRPNTLLSRDFLLEETRGRVADVFDRSIDNMISRLRRKIEADPKQPDTIKTIWGGGYMLTAEVTKE